MFGLHCQKSEPGLNVFIIQTWNELSKLGMVCIEVCIPGLEMVMKYLIIEQLFHVCWVKRRSCLHVASVWLGFSLDQMAGPERLSPIILYKES